MNSIANTMPMATQMGSLPNSLSKEQAQVVYQVSLPSPIKSTPPVIDKNEKQKWRDLKAQGASEANHPEFAHLSSILNAMRQQQQVYKTQMQQQQQQPLNMRQMQQQQLNLQQQQQQQQRAQQLPVSQNGAAQLNGIVGHCALIHQSLTLLP